MGIITPIYFGIWTNCISFSSHPGLACFINNQLAEVFTQCSQDQNVDCAMVSKHHTWKRLIVINFFMNSGDTTSSCSHTCGPTIGKTTQDCFGRCGTCIPLLFMHESLSKEKKWPLYIVITWKLALLAWSCLVD